MKPRSESCEKRLPSVILIGVAKSATRELIDFLRLHPHIQIYHGSSSYEMNYFDMQYNESSEWLRDQMLCSYSNQITVMKNAWYFHNRLVPARIKKFNETVKLILLVREQVARAISAYTFGTNLHQDGINVDRIFSTMVKNTSLNELSKFPFLPTADTRKLKLEDKVFKMSIYDEPMALWLKYFNRSQILILESEEFKKKSVSLLSSIETFLGPYHYITAHMFIYNEEKQFYCIR